MLKLLGRLILFLLGWKTEGPVPAHEKCVLIAAPHTSNWDLPITLAITHVMGRPIFWMGKEQIFRFPFGRIMKWLGGIPIDRSGSHNVVRFTADYIRNHGGPVIVMVPAEGTRSRAEFWKSGFYHIAMEAGVPVYLGYLDYRRKRGGYGIAIALTGDRKKDMDKIRAFYAGKTGKYPGDFGPIRLQDESPVRTEHAA